MPRTSRTLRRVIALLLVPFLLSGCLWYFYPADSTPELLLYESFDGDDFFHTWEFGTESGDERNAELINSRLEVYGPRHFLRTYERFPTELTIRLEWSVTNGDVTSQPYPAPNLSDPDFTVTIDELGLTVQLHLYGFGPDATRIDTVRIVNLFGFNLMEPVSVETTGVTRGHLEVNFTPKGDQMQIDVSVPEISLEANVLANVADESKSAITIGTSGFSGDPRSLEAIYVYRRPVNFGDLL